MRTTKRYRSNIYTKLDLLKDIGFAIIVYPLGLFAIFVAAGFTIAAVATITEFFLGILS